MMRRSCRIHLASLGAATTLLLFAGAETLAQCGLPGTPPCAAKKPAAKPKTKAKPKKAAQPSLAEPVIYVPPKVYRKVCMSPDIPAKEVFCPDDIKPKYLPTEKDPGYDLAVNEFDQALLRKSPKVPFSEGVRCVYTQFPGTTAPCEGDFLSKGDVMVILDRDPTANWLNVFNVETAKEGWVYKGHVTIYYTLSPRQSSEAIVTERSGSYGNPELTVTNDSSRTLTVKVGQSSFELAPYASRKLTLAPGSYKFIGSSPGVYPIMGEKYLATGYTYSWTFFIRSSR